MLHNQIKFMLLHFLSLKFQFISNYTVLKYIHLHCPEIYPSQKILNILHPKSINPILEINIVTYQRNFDKSRLMTELGIYNTI